MKFVEALRAVRPMIESGEELYICWALDTLYDYDDDEECQAYVARVENQLGECASYEYWLSNHHPDFYHALPYIKDGSKMWRDCRVGRLQWIDDMIAKEEAV